MADVDTSFYKIQPQDPLKQPLAIMQLLGAANQVKLGQQTLAARENIANAYKSAIGPDGKVDQAALNRALAGNFLAGPEIGQGITNATGQFNLDSGRLTAAQKMLAGVASNPNASPRDYARAAVAMKAAGVPSDVVTTLMDDVYSAPDQKARRGIALNHGIMSMGTGALEPEAGPIDAENRPTVITAGEGIRRRAGTLPPTNAAAPSSGMATTNVPGFEKVAGAGGEMLAKMGERAAGYADDIWPLQHAYQGLKALGPGSTGPGTEELNTIKSFLVTNLPNLPGVKDTDIEKIKKYDETKKYLLQNAQRMGAGFGHGTDQQLATALSANPNMHINNLAATELTAANIALRRMEQARYLDATASGIQPSRVAAWSSRWATDIDPRAFALDLMSPEQLQRMSKGMTPKAREKFNRSVAKAVAAGVINAPGQAEGAQ